MDGEPHVVVRTLVSVCAFATAAFGLYCTYLAFAGVVVPIFGWELEGSVGSGLVWMFFVTPLVTMLGYWLAVIIALPLGAIFRERIRAESTFSAGSLIKSWRKSTS